MGRIRVPKVTFVCGGCGITGRIESSIFRQKKKRSKSGLVFHSIECYRDWKRRQKPQKTQKSQKARHRNTPKTQLGLPYHVHDNGKCGRTLQIPSTVKIPASKKYLCSVFENGTLTYTPYEEKK